MTDSESGVPSPNHWRTRDAIFAGVIGTAAFATAFVLGTGLILATGIPATGGIANIFPVVFLAVLGFKICPRPFFGIIVMTIVFTLAVPTAIGGPLGPFKIANGIAIGIVWDAIVTLSGRRNGGIMIASSVAAVVSILSVYVGLVILKLPAVEKLRPLLLPLGAVQAVLGLLAAFLALKMYDKRVANWPSVRRFQSAGM